MKRIVLLVLLLIPSTAFAKNVCPAWILSQADKDRYESRLEHASDWISEVEDVLWEQRLHPKWLYLMLSESGGKLDAVSNHGAVGPWQLTTWHLISKSCSSISMVTKKRLSWHTTWEAQIYESMGRQERRKICRRWLCVCLKQTHCFCHKKSGEMSNFI